MDGLITTARIDGRVASNGLIAKAEVRARHHQRRRDPQAPAKRNILILFGFG